MLHTKSFILGSRWFGHESKPQSCAVDWKTESFLASHIVELLRMLIGRHVGLLYNVVAFRLVFESVGDERASAFTKGISSPRNPPKPHPMFYHT